MYILKENEIRAVEENAVERGMEYLRLMENAGAACARQIIRSSNVTDGTNVTVVCGKGKNGGDGFVIARKLYEAGAKVTVILGCGEPRAEDAVEMYQRIEILPIQTVRYESDHALAVERMTGADILVDAVFGIGFRGQPDPTLSRLFADMNLSKAKKISIDIPSGVNCDSETAPSEAFYADETIAISCLKPAHVLLPAALHSGKVTVVKIGIPEDCFEEIGWESEMIDEEYISSLFQKRNPLSNKGNYGKVLCICGSRNMPGAAVLAANGALRTGAGLVTVAFPETAYSGIASKLTEPLMLPVYANQQGFFAQSAVPKILEAVKKADAILIGCGIGVCPDTEFVLREVLKNAECPVVLDADGINIVSEHMDILKTVTAPIVMTPHPGEMARLLGCSAAQVQESRMNFARGFARMRDKLTLVLKGANTLVAQKDSKVYVNTTGNAGMARGGCGDLLAGMIASFIAQGMKPSDASKAAVYLHGKAGDLAAKKYSERAMTVTNMLEFFPELFLPFDK